MSEFIYKLNAMELAAKAFSPHEHGYKQKRLDVISHVESLQAELTSLRTENENFSRAYGLLSVANEQFARDIKALRTELEAANECARINAENSSHWHGEAMSLQAQLAQQPASAVPDILFDSWAVLQEITAKERRHTGPENVTAVLDAIVRLLKPAHSTETSEK